MSNHNVFMDEVEPLFFAKQSKIESFHQQLYAWGFNSIVKRMKNHSSWYHRHFRRDKKDCIDLIKRRALNKIINTNTTTHSIDNGDLTSTTCRTFVPKESLEQVGKNVNPVTKEIQSSMFLGSSSVLNKVENACIGTMQCYPVRIDLGVDLASVFDS